MPNILSTNICIFKNYYKSKLPIKPWPKQNGLGARPKVGPVQKRCPIYRLFSGCSLLISDPFQRPWRWLGGGVRLWIWQAATFPNSGGCWRMRADEGDGPEPNESCHWQFAAWMRALIGKTVNRRFVGKRTGDARLVRNRKRRLGVQFCETPEDAPHSSDCKHDVSHWNLILCKFLATSIHTDIQVQSNAKKKEWLDDIVKLSKKKKSTPSSLLLMLPKLASLLAWS